MSTEPIIDRKSPLAVVTPDDVRHFQERKEDLERYLAENFPDPPNLNDLSHIIVWEREQITLVTWSRNHLGVKFYDPFIGLPARSCQHQRVSAVPQWMADCDNHMFSPVAD